MSFGAFDTVDQRCRETVSQGKPSSRQGCRTDPSTLKPSSLASVKVIFCKTAVGQGVKVLSPDIFAVDEAINGLFAVVGCTVIVCPGDN